MRKVLHRGTILPGCKESNQFASVNIESILIIADSTGVPTSTTGAPSQGTPAPTLPATPTPARDARDEHEVDDFEPGEAYVGQARSHNFYPICDVDWVTFLAKAGREYRVSPSDLALGVDTFLSVGVGGATYTNDDRALGDLSSEVSFVVGGGDVEVIVTVTNRGQFGGGRWYFLTVQEVVPAPTL